MEAGLLTTLEELALTAFQQSLIDLGAKTKEDLAYLGEADLMEAGMKLVEARKLLSNAERSGGSSPGSPYPSSSPSLFRREKEPEMIGKSWTALAREPELSRASSRMRRANSMWWQGQVQRPRRLVFIRHGQSEANVDRSITTVVPDHALHLTAEGREQALDAGRRLKELLGDETVKFTVSPYVRTRETLNGILHAWEGQDMPMSSDVRIREQEYGNYDSPDIESLHKEKKEFGEFYYRFPNGESIADCYDRASLFIESMYRRWSDNVHTNHVIVGHGMMILVTLMRFLRIEIDEFRQYDSLKNCEFIVLERPMNDPKYSLAFTWAPGQEKQFGTLRKKASHSAKPEIAIWDGTPDAPILKSSSYRDSPRKAESPKKAE